MTDKINAKNTAVALGNFDGMHIGHMAVLRETNSFKSKGFVPMAVLFNEHSLKTITGKAPPMLMTVRERDRIINEHGLEIGVVIFNDIKDLSPREFVEKILVGRFNAKAVCCGYNYRFGKNAEGNAATMKEICFELGLECRVTGEVDVDSEAVSSTEIRRHIENGEIEKADKMLGHPFGFCSKVIDGDKRGRTLGFPTINQELPPELVLPKFGVYQSVVTVNGESHIGVTNVGKRPTVGTEKVLSETYIIDFHENIYGKDADIRLVRFIRPEKKFSSFDELAAQIKADANEVR